MSTAVALPRLGAAASRLRFVTYELALWLALYPVYLAIRGLSIDSYGTALANARDLISVERSLSIFHEGAVQDALSALDGPLSTYYMLGFGHAQHARRLEPDRRDLRVPRAPRPRLAVGLRRPPARDGPRRDGHRQPLLPRLDGRCRPSSSAPSRRSGCSTAKRGNPHGTSPVPARRLGLRAPQARHRAVGPRTRRRDRRGRRVRRQDQRQVLGPGHRVPGGTGAARAEVPSGLRHLRPARVRGAQGRDAEGRREQGRRRGEPRQGDRGEGRLGRYQPV